MNNKFYICPHCGNIVTLIHDVGVPVFCCGKKMEEIVPNSVEASGEKHIPVATVENGVVNVNVGAVDHPMQAEHYIQWVWLKTEKGIQCVKLNPDEAPKATFCVAEGDKPLEVYAYCNLHGLWKAEI